MGASRRRRVSAWRDARSLIEAGPPAFSEFVMIRLHSVRPRSGEHCFCAGQTP